MKNFTLKGVVTALMLIVITLTSVDINGQTTIYSSDFNAGADGWTSGSGWVRDNSSFAGKTDNHWHTSPFNNYTNGMNVVVTSGTIDLTGFTGISFQFDIRYQSNDNDGFNYYDGTQVEYFDGTTWTVLGANGGGTNWYNRTYVDALNSAGTSSNDGWAGINGSFQTASFTLPAAMDGNANARFRVRFASDTFCCTDDGVAFDNILIEGTSSAPQPEINITGLGNTILDGDTTPVNTDDTDFGSLATGATNPNTFTITNSGAATLNLTGAPLVSITGAGASEFSVTTTPSTTVSSGGGTTTFEITYAPTVGGTHNATVSIANDDSDENPYTFDITGIGVAPAPEMDVRGLGVSITDGDTTPTTTDNTDFGSTTTGSPIANTFSIINSGTADLNLTDASPYISITGTGAAQYSVTTIPSTPIASGGGATTFVITYNPTVGGTHNATVSIANNDSDENPYNFNITASATGPAPEINLTGDGNNILDGDTTPATSDGTDYGFLLVGSSSSQDFIISNSGTGTLTLTGASPYVTLSGAGAGQFSVSTAPNNSIAASGGATTFTIDYNPAAAGTHAATVSIANDDSDENPFTFTIQGQASTSLTPEIDISGNGNSIADGDTTPSTLDATDFGSISIGSSATADYTISNTGSGLLTLTGASPYVTIAGTGAANFSVTTAPSQTITASNSTIYQIRFNPLTAGTHNATVTILSDDSDESPYTYDITGIGVSTTAPQYTIYYEQFDTSNGGWTASNPGGNTVWSYGTNGVEPGTEGNYWYTDNYDNYASNSDTYVTSPTLDMTGFDDLRLTLDIRYVTESAYDGMNVEYSTDNGTTWTILGSYSATPIENWYNDDDVDGLGSGVDGWSGLNSGGAGGGRSDFLRARIDLPVSMHNNPLCRLRVQFASDGSSTDNGVNFDNVTIEGNPIAALADPALGPGDVTSNLKLWLKSNVGISDSDGSNVTTWEDEAYDNDAVVGASTAPVYYDNATQNINHNPVLTFDNVSDTELKGKGGYYTDEYWVVMQKDGSINASSALEGVVSGRISPDQFGEDGTGLFINPGSIRFAGEDNLISHMIGSTPANTSSGSPLSYGRAYNSSTDSIDDEVIILNIKYDPSTGETAIFKNGTQIDNDTGNAFDQGTGTVGGLLDYDTVENSIYALGVGRITVAGTPYDSHYNGKMTEFISYSVPNSTLDQLKIQSYLAIKNGVTLHDINSTTATNLGDENYIDSSGSTIWDVSVNAGFNYDIAGIGRDDDSGLNQKQSTSSNADAMVTMGLTDIYSTNNENIASNSNAIANQNFLMWGNDGASLNAASPIVVDMSNGISGLSSIVDFTSVERTWKIQETGSIGDVKISVPEATLSATLSPPGDYLMFVSDTPTFSPTSEYRIMTLNGANLEATYDFDGVKYITFGYAPEYYYERSISFDGTQDFLDAGDVLDLTGPFTLSVWVKRINRDYSIISKRDAAYTEGYDMSILNNNRVEMSWFDASNNTQDIRSTVQIPENQWHHIAVIYDGTEANLYIDGVLDSTETLNPPVATDQYFLIGAADGLFPADFYEGALDEVRVWDIALSESQLRYIMNQEIENISGNVDGKIVPQGISKNDVVSIPWSDLGGYFPMNRYTFTNVKDESDNNLVAAIRNLETVDFQTAPIPYHSEASGGWATAATWENNTVIELPCTTSIVDNTQTIDWNIVVSNHDITTNGNNTLLSLDIQSGEFTIGNDSKMEVTHYLKLDGTMDLVGESQLVQTSESDLDPASTGSIERDQQGTADTYTYNFWSSPVSVINTSSINNDYTISNVLRNGTDANNPGSIIYTGALDGNGSPFTLSAYWMFKYANQTNGSAAWSHIGSAGSITPGEGYTMKGPGTGSVATPQNYVFVGKPNNSTTAEAIAINITAGNDYLVGNPFPSALDADDFIGDNPHLDGTLYFWEHWGGGNHIQNQYQGGYAMYNLSGGAPAVSHPLVDQTGGGTKTPQRYVPVSQGFFVKATSTGTIDFNNSQRNFVRETGSSIFLFSDEVENDTRAANTSNNTSLDPDDSFYDAPDKRMKFRIGFTSPYGVHRQLLLTVDSNTTFDYDPGYDGVVSDAPYDDMNWKIGTQKAVIQGIPNVYEQNVFPLHIKLSQGGNTVIGIDSLENVNDPDIHILLWDQLQDTFTNLQEEDYIISLPTGNYTDRYAIVFKQTGDEEDPDDDDDTDDDSDDDTDDNDDDSDNDTDDTVNDDNDDDDNDDDDDDDDDDQPQEKPGDVITTERPDWDTTTTSTQSKTNSSSVNSYYNKPQQLIHLDIKGQLDGVELQDVSLYTLLGQVVKKWKVSDDATNIKLPTGDISTGAYLLRIATTNGTMTKKIIIH